MRVNANVSPGREPGSLDDQARVETIPLEEVFRPLAEGGCPLMR